MKAKIYKRAMLTYSLLCVLSYTALAQEDSVKYAPHNKDKSFRFKMDDLNIDLKMDLKDMAKDLSFSINKIIPKIDVELKGLENDIKLDIDDIAPKIDIDLKDIGDNFSYNFSYRDNEKTHRVEKHKSYSKTYTLDGNDKIKLSNQYGKILVNTWDRHEVKVDVQIKAEAGDENAAQKLLDGVQIRDSKEADQVSFRTSIESNNNGSWKIWDWGNNKNHKLEIDYVVYMPAKTDLNVEQSYGSISLPDLDGKVRISSSYGSATAQKLSNPNNDIEGSYGSLKVENLNGSKLEYSYGSVDIGECNNIKADLSYGSFKLGTLKGSGDLDLSYVGGFKIEELGSSFKKLSVNSSYSGVSLGVPNNNNFDFDVTVNYGGFSYNEDKTTITSKNPPDGSKRISMTKNYKGHFGKGSSSSQVTIRTTYGGVNFE